MKRFHAIACIAMLLMMAVSGCAVRSDVTAMEEESKARMQQVTDRAKSGQAGYGLKPFQVSHSSYIDSFSVSLENGHSMLRGKTVTFRESGVYLADIGDKLARTTGIKVRFAPDLAKRKDIVNTTMSIKHSGQLTELLDQVASFYNINWEYGAKDNTVLFFYQKTKVYSIAAFLGDLDINTEISNKSDSADNASATGGAETGGSSGTNEHTVKTKGKYEAWSEFTTNIAKMISKDGAVVASKGAGTITVTDSPVVLARIDDYMKSMNNKMSRQVSINVTVYNFKSSDQFDLSANLNGVFNDGTTRILFGDTPTNMVSTVGSFMAGIVQGSDSKWAGSNAIANAMKSKGRMSLETTASGITMNNQPLPVQALRRTSYLASSSTTMNGDNAETSLVPGQIVSGMSILITPHIQPDDSVNLEYNMSYSVVDEIKTIESGSSSIQTPDVSSRSIMQRFQVKTGSTVVIAGYVSNARGDKSALGILSGLIGTSDEKEYVIIMIDISDATLPSYSALPSFTLGNAA